MELNQFQSDCLTTEMPSCQNIDYPIHEIIEESAELYEKFFNSLPEDVRENDIQLKSIYTAVMHAGKLAKARAKAVRKGEVESPVISTGTSVERKEMSLEAFDIAWGISAVSDKLGYRLEDVAVAGLYKLADRAKRQKVDGNGDHR